MEMLQHFVSWRKRWALYNMHPTKAEEKYVECKRLVREQQRSVAKNEIKQSRLLWGPSRSL